MIKYLKKNKLCKSDHESQLLQQPVQSATLPNKNNRKVIRFNVISRNKLGDRNMTIQDLNSPSPFIDLATANESNKSQLYVNQEQNSNILSGNRNYVKSCSPAPMQVRYDGSGSPQQRTLCGSPQYFYKTNIKNHADSRNNASRSLRNYTSIKIANNMNIKTSRVLSYQKRNNRPKRIFAKFLPEQLERIKAQYYEQRKLKESLMLPKMTKSGNMNQKVENNNPNLERFPIQTQRWNSLNRFLQKKCKRENNNPTLMDRIDQFVEKQQEINCINAMQSESTQFGCLRWMSELRNSDKNNEPIRTPTGHYCSTRFSSPDNRPKAKHNFEICVNPKIKGKDGSFRKAKHFMNLKRRLLNSKLLLNATTQPKSFGDTTNPPDSEGTSLNKRVDALSEFEIRLNNLKEVRVEGRNKFEMELESCLKIPEDQRMKLIGIQ
ncbi:unnamed protein product [Moneuplotes crassus]|uniref:Uncharacterized protein n=1 Tax=Euplotes crassus TaxID=5936 RepID=A0AAD1UFW4_EUPCR|nr:unnamed protein product [Moneuplotes crassus]